MEDVITADRQSQQGEVLRMQQHGGGLAGVLLLPSPLHGQCLHFVTTEKTCDLYEPIFCVYILL